MILPRFLRETRSPPLHDGGGDEVDTPLLTLAELSRSTGIPYYRVVYAHQTGAIPEPPRVGNHRVYTPEDVERVREHFAQRDRGADAPKS
jgi:hypothetical protein